MHLGQPSTFSYFTGVVDHAATYYHGITLISEPVRPQSSLLTRNTSCILIVNKTWWMASVLKIALTSYANCVSGRKVVIRSVYQYACCDSQCSYIYAVARVMPGSIVPMTSRVDRQRRASRNETLDRARCLNGRINALITTSIISEDRETQQVGWGLDY